MVVTAKEIKALLDRAFMASGLYEQLMRLQLLNEYPDGFFIYQGQLQDAVLRWFLG